MADQQEIEPKEVRPPGEIIREAMEARGWMAADLAEVTGWWPSTISDLVGGKRSISPETAIDLAAALGTTPEYWLDLEQAYQLWRNRDRGMSEVARRARLYSYAPVREMVRRGWLEGKSVDELEAAACRFFGVNSLEEEPKPFRVDARKSTSYSEPLTPVQRAWVMRAKHLAPAAPVTGKFSPSGQQKTTERLRLLTHEPKEARHVPRVLGDAGIRYVVIEPLSGVKIDGACLWLPDGPVIAMSIRYDRIDNFWFCLLHEVCHVYDKAESVDADLVESRGKADRPPQELKADAFAGETLIDPAVLEGFILRKRPLYSTAAIEGFAKLRGVHPGIVVGQLQVREEVPWGSFRKLLAPIRDIVTGSALTDGWGSVAPTFN